MWIYMSDAFFSIVEHRRKLNFLLVRARRQGDIERVFKHPDVKVKVTPEADYRYRADIRRDLVGTVIGFSVQGIGYDNFKASVNDRARHDAYLEVWMTMKRYQDLLTRPRRRR